MSKPKILVIAAIMFLLAANGSIAVAQVADPPEGTAVVFNDVASSDAIRYSMKNVPDPGDGKTYVGWLVSGSSSTNTGEMTVTSGAISHQFDSNSANYTGANLVASFDQVIVTTEVLGANVSERSDATVWSYSVPAGAMTHIRQLATGLDTLKAQLAIAKTSADSAMAATTLADAKQSMEQVVNVIEGTTGSNYGDLDGNGTIDNPGDGVGALVHAVNRIQATHASLAVPDDTLVKNNALGVEATGANAGDFAGQARDHAISSVLTATELSVAQLFSSTVSGLLDSAIGGVDADADGTIEAIAGEGGTDQAIASTQMMATYLLAGTAPDPISGALPIIAVPTVEPEPVVEAPLLPATGDRMIPLFVQMALLLSAILLVGGASVLVFNRRTKVSA